MIATKTPRNDSLARGLSAAGEDLLVSVSARTKLPIIDTSFFPIYEYSSLLINYTFKAAMSLSYGAGGATAALGVVGLCAVENLSVS